MNFSSQNEFLNKTHHWKPEHNKISIHWIFFIACMNVLNKIMHTWIQLLILTHLYKGVILLICVSVFLPKSVVKKQEKHHAYCFLPQQFPKNCVLVIKCPNSRIGRKEIKKANTSKIASICIPEYLLPKVLHHWNI